MVEAMNEAVHQRGAPFLGVCVGMQLLADAGEEFGRHEGLGWIGGTVRLIAPQDPAVTVPHMGWNDVTLRGAPPLLRTGEASFLHSYHFDAADPAAVAALTNPRRPLIPAVARARTSGVEGKRGQVRGEPGG